MDDKNTVKDVLDNTQIVIVGKIPTDENPLFRDVWTDYSNKYNALAEKIEVLGIDPMELRDIIEARDKFNNCGRFEIYSENINAIKQPLLEKEVNNRKCKFNDNQMQVQNDKVSNELLSTVPAFVRKQYAKNPYLRILLKYDYLSEENKNQIFAYTEKIIAEQMGIHINQRDKFEKLIDRGSSFEVWDMIEKFADKLLIRDKNIEF